MRADISGYLLAEAIVSTERIVLNSAQLDICTGKMTRLRSTSSSKLHLYLLSAGGTKRQRFWLSKKVVSFRFLMISARMKSQPSTSGNNNDSMSSSTKSFNFFLSASDLSSIIGSIRRAIFVSGLD